MRAAKIENIRLPSSIFCSSVMTLTKKSEMPYGIKTISYLLLFIVVLIVVLVIIIIILIPILILVVLAIILDARNGLFAELRILFGADCIA